ncbi:hypothetical protein VTL71DRAFT_6143 [Oculimacula yallundae]|uniref:Uncharacterized protein n=1 Tax=Oculimacula yallundae TaxID=86028 RepID=A0ABR4BZI2_9HELO
MAPDLNSVPASTRPSASSPQQTSTTQQPDPSSSQFHAQHTSPIPLSASTILNVLPSNQNTVNQSQTMASPGMANTGSLAGDNTGVGTGPGPLRHPRPLTAADLHLQLEKEQEAVVNRLTRELSLLRAAQNASVVSNTSSTSAGLPDSHDHNANHLLSGPSHPTPSQRRHHRSSSATSSRSASALASLSSIPSTTADRTRGPSISQTTNPTSSGNTYPQSISLSRQNSTTGQSQIHTPGRSGTSSPLPMFANTGSYPTLASDTFPPYFSTTRPVPHRDVSSSSLAMTTGSLTGDRERGGGGTEMLRADSITSVHTTGRYEEAAFHRHELDNVKRENEVLKRRIRELERTLRRRRESDADVAGDRVRSESVSTTASVRDGGGVSLVAGTGTGAGGPMNAGGSLRSVRGRERAKEDDELELGLGRESESDVQVGESARGAGI